MNNNQSTQPYLSDISHIEFVYDTIDKKWTEKSNE